VIETIRSDEFKKTALQMGGYDASRTGEELHKCGVRNAHIRAKALKLQLSLFRAEIPKSEIKDMLLDPYKRKINYLRISVTDRCNLRCRYCMPEEGIPLISHQDILTYEEILRIVRVFASEGISKVRLTGGEPLVRKGIVDFVSRLSQIEEIKDLSLTTNGLLLKDLAEVLRQAGLKRVNISLDSLKRERFYQITRRDDFERVWSGIEEALRVGLTPIKVNMVAIKGLNDDEIEAFARLTSQLPLTVRYIEYMPSGNGEEWKETDISPSPRSKHALKKWGI
jgi:cyclic pyranopterin phosphate synthase